MPSKPKQALEAFANPQPQRDYLIHIDAPEFTCLCPLTGQPDFANLVFDYVADRHCVELKSLKLYLWSFRNVGQFHEAVTNRIVDDLVALLAPRFLRLTARWYVRGGITTTIVAEHRSSGWKPAPLVELPAPGGSTLVAHASAPLASAPLASAPLASAPLATAPLASAPPAGARSASASARAVAARRR